VSIKAAGVAHPPNASITRCSKLPLSSMMLAVVKP
jgi:hypothetical protein